MVRVEHQSKQFCFSRHSGESISVSVFRDFFVLIDFHSSFYLYISLPSSPFISKLFSVLTGEVDVHLSVTRVDFGVALVGTKAPICSRIFFQVCFFKSTKTWVEFVRKCPSFIEFLRFFDMIFFFTELHRFFSSRGTPGEK